MKKQTVYYWGGALLMAAAVTFVPTLSATAQEEGDSASAADPAEATENAAADETRDAADRPRRGGRGPAGLGDRPRGERRGGRRGGGPGGPGGQSPGDRPGPGPEGRGPQMDGSRLFDLFDIDEDDQLSRDEFRRMAEAAQIFRHMSGRGHMAGRGHQAPRGQFGQRTPGMDRPDFPGARGPRRDGPRGERPPRGGDQSDG